MKKKAGPQQSTDTGALEKIIDEVIAANPKQLEQYRGGKKTVIAFFVGQVMKASKGSANPALVNELLEEEAGVTSLKTGNSQLETAFQCFLNSSFCPLMSL